MFFYWNPWKEQLSWINRTIRCFCIKYEGNGDILRDGLHFLKSRFDNWNTGWYFSICFLQIIVKFPSFHFWKNISSFNHKYWFLFKSKNGCLCFYTTIRLHSFLWQKCYQISARMATDHSVHWSCLIKKTDKNCENRRYNTILLYPLRYTA